MCVSDVIDCGKEVEVKISLQPKDALSIKQNLLEDPEVEKEMKDKFLIQSIMLTEEYEELIGLADGHAQTETAMSEILAPVWKNAPSVGCNFLPPSVAE